MRGAPWAALACLALVPVLWAASQTEAGQAFDAAGHEALTGWPGSDLAWREASWPGLSAVGGLVLAACAIACARLGDRDGALASLAASAVIPVTHLLKSLTGRARPEGAIAEGLAFPSGHAAVAAAAYGVAALVLARTAIQAGAPRWVGPLATGTWLGLAAAVGVARIAAGVHWPTDVAAGWALGGAVAALASWWTHGRRSPTRPASSL